MTEDNWYDDEHTGMIEAHAHFELSGEAFDPDEVTSRLGITPTMILRAGDQRTAPNGRLLGGEYEYSKWMIETDGLLDSTSLARHLRLLLDMLEPRAEALAGVMRDLGCRSEFMCYFVANTDQLKMYQGPGFSSSLLGRIAQLGADLTFDFATCSSDEDTA